MDGWMDGRMDWWISKYMDLIHYIMWLLVVRQDDSYTLAIDQQVLVSGNFLKDLT